jgi:hypothetical protein
MYEVNASAFVSSCPTSLVCPVWLSLLRIAWIGLRNF